MEDLKAGPAMNVNQYIVERTVKGFFLHILLAVFAATCLFPLFWMLRCALMTNQTVFTDKSLIPHVIQLGNFLQAWKEGDFGMFFLNSVIYTTSVVIGIVLVSSLAAFAFSRLNFPGKNFFFYMF